MKIKNLNEKNIKEIKKLKNICKKQTEKLGKTMCIAVTISSISLIIWGYSYFASASPIINNISIISCSFALVASTVLGIKAEQKTNELEKIEATEQSLIENENKESKKQFDKENLKNKKKLYYKKKIEELKQEKERLQLLQYNKFTSQHNKSKTYKKQKRM